ncbi:DKNYY domain-containing protein [Flavobacterium sp.]|uniref:DKNYY domain-containing protein n=1 Tax=Flavobacterium sp. TaxID=239 RepID=UPI00260475FC|nr:DKNYY domain-containing protein [Flavobacterium sp.]
MKVLNKIFLISFFIFFLFSCKNSKHEKSNPKKDSVWNARVEKINYYKSKTDSLNKILNWKKTNYGLWKSKNGDLAIKSQASNEQQIDIEKYITQLCCEGKEIKDVVDTLTFKYLGSSFYKDKKNVYTHYVMSDGGNFWIVEMADAKTFEVIGKSCSAKDKNYIYGERAMKMDSVDYKTFKTCDDCSCFAKDKNGYYFWDSKIDLNEVNDDETKKIIEKLKKL